MPECLLCQHTNVTSWAKAQDEEYFTNHVQYVYYRCNYCKVQFIDPVPRDDLQQIYPENYYSFDKKQTSSLPFKIKNWLDSRFFRKFITQLPHKKIAVLDIGGGEGTQLNLVKATDKRITSTTIVDIDQKAGELATQHGHEYFCGRFEDYYPDKKFEFILMMNFIEHIDNPVEILVKAHDLLTADGFIMIKTPNTDSLDARLFRNMNWGGYHCPRHWILFNQENFSYLVQQAGLKIRSLKYTQGAPFWTTSILFLLSRKNWIKTSKQRPVPNHPLYTILNVIFACIDLLRVRFSKTSQMLIILERSKDDNN